MSEVDIREIAECTCLRLRRTTRRVTQIYDRALGPAGLTVNQFGLLARLYGAALRAESLSVGMLAERVGMDPTTVNRGLKPLEAEGLVEIAWDPADRRARAIAITEAGIAKLSEAVPLWRDAQALVTGAIGLDVSVSLNGLLELSYAKLAS